MESTLDEKPRAAEPSKNDTHVQIQEDVFHEEETFCCGQCKRTLHIKSFVLNVLLFASLAFFFLTLYFYQTNPSSSLNKFFIAWPVLLGVYFFYFIEVMACSTSRYLWNLYVVEDVVSLIDRLKKVPPSLYWTCECYHYETRTREVTESYTENGETHYRTRTETYQEKVVTYSGTEHFQFNKFTDDSGQVSEEITRFNATKVKFSKAWRPGDEATAQAYIREKELFQTSNRNRDVHFDFWEHFEIDGFKSKMLCIMDVKKRPWAMRWGFYVLFSVVLMSSFLYRLWLDRKTVRARFQFIKTVYKY